jgi:hypothetical protein
MKRLLASGMVALSMALWFSLIQTGCNANVTPVTTGGLIYSKPTPTPTIGTAVFPVLYSDGAFAPEPGLVVDAFSGGGAAGYPTFNPIDTTLNGYNGDWYGFLDQWTSTEISNLGGYSGIVVTGGAVNFSSYTTCTFWAKANESGASVGFNAAEPSGDTANVPESLTTSWAEYSLNIANGTRTDGVSGSIAAVANYFVVVVTAAPASTPLNVSFDQVQFQ